MGGGGVPTRCWEAIEGDRGRGKFIDFCTWGGNADGGFGMLLLGGMGGNGIRLEST